MAEHSIAIARSARRELEVLGPSLVSRILLKIEALAVHQRPHGSRSNTKRSADITPYQFSGYLSDLVEGQE
ncbi:MAG: hypothetical protein MRJ68_03825 [Nitrospira sp.]|nr:hypothetical protein [Nitrospira sp.]